jgi:soluble lytic murein transglycosylase-like protein
MQRRGLLACLVLCLAAPNLPSAQPDLYEPAPPVTTSEATPPPDPVVEDLRRQFARHHTGLSSFELEQVAHTIAHESERLGVSPSLVLGVIQIESGFYNFAVSNKGARGLMQIMPATGRTLAQRHGIPWQGPETLFDPIVNVRVGIGYIAWLEARFGRIDAALAAYNWGPARIGQRLRSGAGLPQRYVRDVLSAYGVHAARSAARPVAIPATGVFTSAATNPSTAPMAAASPAR